MPLKRKEKIALGVLGGLGALFAMLGFGGGAAGSDTLSGTPTGGGGSEPEPGKADLPPPPKEPVPKQGVIGEIPTSSFEPGIHDSIYPTPGRMYQVKKGDIFGGQYGSRSIAYRALLSAAYAAAIENGKNDAEAKAFAATIAKSGGRRNQYIDAILCAGINDAAYGTWGYDKTGSNKTRVGPHGRGIRLLKYHANNRQRLVEGRPLVRNIRWGDFMSAGDESGTPMDYELAEAYEYLYLPHLDLQAILSGDIVVDEWDPPFEWEIDVPEDMAGQVFGCGDGEVLLS